MSKELVEALKQLQREKNMDPKDLVDALEQALVSAYRKNYHIEEETEIRVTVDYETGDIKVFAKEEGKEEKDVTPENFGRIAAQTAKQVILQRLREAERGAMYEEYRGREGDIVTGIVQQSDARYTLISLGKVEALLPPNEQVQTERYRHGTRLKAYITEVRKTTKDPQIVVSRSHPGLLKRLFELEVPELTEGFCEIKSVAREAGSRSKIAVWSSDPNVDPVGACVGPRGSRVRMVVGELWGEKIDVVHFSEDPSELIANALSPAKVKEVKIDEEEKSAEVIVPDDQLSLAIGKEGQNARLAAKLTSWRIDIKSESQAEGKEPIEEARGEEQEVSEKVEEEQKESGVESPASAEATAGKPESEEKAQKEDEKKKKEEKPQAEAEEEKKKKKPKKEAEVVEAKEEAVGEKTEEAVEEKQEEAVEEKKEE